MAEQASDKRGWPSLNIERVHAFAGSIWAWRGSCMAELEWLIRHPKCERFIITVIALNALTLGLETSRSVMASYGPADHGRPVVARIALVPASGDSSSIDRADV